MSRSERYRQEWSHYSFTAILDQSLILSLEDQARWLLGQTAGRPEKTPNFIEFMGVDPLRKVQPEAVRIIGK